MKFYITILSCILCFSLWSQGISLIKEIPSTDTTWDQYGHKTAVHNDIAVISAWDDETGPDPNIEGAIYIFYKDYPTPNNWGLVRKMYPSDIGAGDTFGSSIDIFNDIIALKSKADTGTITNHGAVYLIGKDVGGPDNWGLIKKIEASDKKKNDYFGIVSLHSNTLAVGTKFTDDNGTSSGSVYIFEKDFGGIDNWGEVIKLTASDASFFDWFGAAVDLYGDNLVVGAPNNDDKGTDTGSIYLFNRNMGGANNWGEVLKYIPNSISGLDRFGGSVGIYENNIVAGAAGSNSVGHIGGSAHLLEIDLLSASVINEIAVLTPNITDIYYGSNVEIWKNYLWVGGLKDYFFSKNCGGLNNWGEFQIIDTDFTSLGFTDNYVIAGRRIDGTPGTSYVYSNQSCNCQSTIIDLNGNGICDLDEDDDCTTIFADNFEMSSGHWTANGGDASRIMSPFSPNGVYSMMIRDNSGVSSSVTSDQIDLTGIGSILLNFNFRSSQMNTMQSFNLEISTDGGASFSIVESWVLGVDFYNASTYNETVSIQNTFGQVMIQFRFRCNGLEDDDQVLLDDIIVQTCVDDDCPDYLVQNTNSAILQSEHLEIGIETDGIVLASSNIEFAAGDHIEMIEGFEVKNGGIYHAYIQSCQ